MKINGHNFILDTRYDNNIHFVCTKCEMEIINLIYSDKYIIVGKYFKEAHYLDNLQLTCNDLIIKNIIE